MTVPVRKALDWGALAPLRLRARTAAEGLFSGVHRSVRRGAGVEFAGHRAYLPGDDLRFIDRHAFMRHGAFVLREFETETERALKLVMDATASMSFRGGRAPGAKLAFAAVVAAALGWVALRGGDRVALDWIGGKAPRSLPAGSGMHAFERLVGALEHGEASGGVSGEELELALARVERNAPRGAVMVLFSDLLDLPERAAERISALAARGRTLVVMQVLDPDEIELPFEGPVRLRALEGDLVVDTDAPLVRAEYQAALERLREDFRHELVARGGRFVQSSTAENPSEVVRAVLTAVSGGGA
ncbi:MAG TPA: DUF58 domain-containing protein [Polyangiaceae bacterium]